jgi:vacuolar-type H+-ATPase subunit H
MDTNDGKTKEMWGRRFKVVKNGLDEAEVVSFVTGLIEQNKELTTKLEHIDTLKKLAEKTVIEAEKQAKDIKAEIEEKAQARAEAILAEAQEKAQVEASRIVSEADQKAERILLEKIELAKKQGEDILNAAEERAERIKADANKEAEEIIARAKQEVTAAEQQARELIRSAEEKAQFITTNANEEAGKIIATARQQAAELEEKAQAMVTSAEKKAEDILNEAREKGEEIIRTKTEAASKEAEGILKDARKKATEEAALMKQEAEQLLARSKKVTQNEIKNKLKKAYQELLADLGAIKETEVIPGLAEDKVSEQPAPEAKAPAVLEPEILEVKEPVQPTSRTEKEAATLYRGPVELVIPPPLGLDRMLQLHKHLRNIPDVEVLNLGVAADKSITIRLVVQNPIPLRSILEELPEVEQATESPQEIESTMPSRKGGEKVAVKRIIVTTRK